MKDKKMKEKMILNYVYNQERFVIDDRVWEQPDFKLYDMTFGSEFGVEITELYKNQTSAKSQNDEKYKGGIVFKPTASEYISILCERIKHKNKKIEKYDKSLEYINLIISDMEDGFFQFGLGDILTKIICDTLEKNILVSEYNEIFLVSKKNQFHKILPLKLSVILKEIYYIKKEAHKKFNEDFMELVFMKLSHKGVHDMEVVATDFGRKLRINDYILGINKHNTICKASHGEWKSSESGVLYKMELSHNEIHKTMIDKNNEIIYPPIII